MREPHFGDHLERHLQSDGEEDEQEVGIGEVVRFFSEEVPAHQRTLRRAEDEE